MIPVLLPVLLLWPPETLPNAQAQHGPRSPITLSRVTSLSGSSLPAPCRSQLGQKKRLLHQSPAPCQAVLRGKEAAISPPPGMVTRMPGDNDRLSVFCLVRSCMQMTWL